MVKKSTAKRNSAGFSNQLQSLEKCLKEDFTQLEKAYPKALADAEKAIKRVSQELKKAKLKPKTTKGAKAGKAAKGGNAATAALEKELARLKAEKAGLQTGHKKHTAFKKLLQQFEKTWAKKAKKAAKPRKAAKKSGRTTARKTKSSAESANLRQAS